MLSLLLAVSLVDAKPKKNKAPPAPPQGWHREEGWAGDCYYPVDYTALGEGEKKMARQTALEEMKKQWEGVRDDNVKFDANLIEEVDITLLGRPTNIEAISRGNLEQCQKVRKGGDLGAWQSYLSALPAKLTAGECIQPLTYTLFDYLDIGRTWQREIGLCKGDKAHVIASAKDRYRISDSGAWLTVEGDVTQKAVAAEYPCNIEGCFVGMLVGKFVTDSGVETVFPIGTETTFVAPEHGIISFSINDTVWYDNKWFKSATIEDRTSLTIEPGN
ncbi:MAG: hypothetical protein Q8P18_04255 [Pseudomonadota bacterium]|nr:hypothetical protein [Pseudomonadota bacterium]